MRLRGMGNADDEFHASAIAQNPGHVTATFIIPELQGRCSHVGSSEDPSIRQVKPFHSPFPLGWSRCSMGARAVRVAERPQWVIPRR